MGRNCDFRRTEGLFRCRAASWSFQRIPASLGGSAKASPASRLPPSRSMTPHRIALLFNANKVYDRQVIAGIGHYLNSTRVEWDLFMEEDFRSRMRDIHQFR